jgi:hypothetical protein
MMVRVISMLPLLALISVLALLFALPSGGTSVLFGALVSLLIMGIVVKKVIRI